MTEREPEWDEIYFGSCGEEVRDCLHLQRRYRNRKQKEGKR